MWLLQKSCKLLKKKPNNLNIILGFFKGKDLVQKIFKNLLT